MKQKKNYFFIGTTAELIKIAPIIRELEKRNIQSILISSGQNRINFEILRGFIKKQRADISFPEKINKSSIYFFLTWAIRTVLFGVYSLRKELQAIDKKNSYFIIQGDTVSSTIGACIAKLYNMRLVYVESGDLSFNLLEPFPEEICRNINIQLADILFPPTRWAVNNLHNVKKPKICTGQNTIIETFWWAIKKRNKRNFTKKLNNNYYVIIMHRQEHVIFRKEWSRNIMDFIIKNANQQMTCVILDHPLTNGVVKSLKLNPKKQNIKLIPQLPYSEFLKLLQNAEFIASDSATLQQEAYYMGKPLLALRNYTEQIEGVGKNYVLSKGDKDIIGSFLKNYRKYKTKPIIINGSPSKIIVDYLLGKF